MGSLDVQDRACGSNSSQQSGRAGWPINAALKSSESTFVCTPATRWRSTRRCGDRLASSRALPCPLRTVRAAEPSSLSGQALRGKACSDSLFYGDHGTTRVTAAGGQQEYALQVNDRVRTTAHTRVPTVRRNATTKLTAASLRDWCRPRPRQPI